VTLVNSCAGSATTGSHVLNLSPSQVDPSTKLRLLIPGSYTQKAHGESCEGSRRSFIARNEGFSAFLFLKQVQYRRSSICGSASVMSEIHQGRSEDVTARRNQWIWGGEPSARHGVLWSHQKLTYLGVPAQPELSQELRRANRVGSLSRT
jgi:hypothetical protein